MENFIRGLKCRCQTVEFAKQIPAHFTRRRISARAISISLISNMFLLRKLGKLLRGNSTLFQIISATILGSLVGFSASPDVAPGLYVVVFVLVLVLNCNLVLFAINGAIAYILSLLLTPLSLFIGTFLLTGPTAGLFEAVIRAPFSAWFGWEYYVFAGALPIALLYGVLSGMAIDRLIHSYRVKMASLEENSERFNKLIKNPLFRVLTFVFLGGFRDKKSFQEMLDEGRKGLPIRISGAIAVALSIPLIWACLNMFDSTFYTTRVREALTQLNGASVDIESVDVGYAQGRVSISSLAIADPENLQRNRVSAQEITADVSIAALLSKRLLIDNITADGVFIHSERRVSGQTADKQEPEDKAKAAPEGSKKKDKPKKQPSVPAGTDIEGAAALFEKYREPLAKARAWFEKRKQEDEFAKAPQPKKAKEKVPSWKQRLEQQIAESGVRGAVAEHLLPEYPTLTLKDAQIRDIRVNGTDFGIFDLEASWISDAPNLLENSPEISLENRSGQIGAYVKGESFRDGTLPTLIELKGANLDLELIRAQLPKNVQSSVEAGKFSLNGKGRLDAGNLQMPIDVSVDELTVQIPNFGRHQMDKLALTATLAGPIDQLEIDVDSQQIQQEIQKAAEQLLKQKAKDKISEELEKRLGSEAGDAGGLGDVLKGFLNR